MRGEAVTVPPQPHNGVKFMFHYRNTLGGAEQWPGARLPTGDFGWRLASMRTRCRSVILRSVSGKGCAVLGVG